MTIKDIAALAGVSPATVSKVLNNKAEAITEETREKVLRIVKEYNFKPFHRYIQNDSSFSGFVGLLLPGGAEEYSDFISGAQVVSNAAGYSMILCTCQSRQDMEKHLNSLFCKSADGIALYLDQETDLEAAFADAPQKLVYAAATSCRALAEKCVACCSYAAAAKLATEHLLQFGHREIAMIGWSAHLFTDDLISGYHEALYDHKIVIQGDAVCLCNSLEDVADYIRRFTYGNGTAFLCQDAQIAACVYRVLSSYGLKIPRDYSIVGLSTHSAPLGVFEPSLTTVDIRLQELGQFAMKSVIAKIEKNAKASEPLETFNPRLCEGRSVASPLQKFGKQIVVVGSMNMDVIIHMQHIPASGENLRARRILNLPGGKGANQGVGAAKLGASVYVIGCLGSDPEGRLLYNSLVENGVNIAGIQIIREKPTGKAYILVAENGESTIIRARGANNELQPSIVKASESCFEDARFCLISTEIPWETVLYTIDFCAKKGIKTIVKPTVQKAIPPDVLKKITFLVPNEKELAIQVDEESSVEKRAARLFDAGTENIIVTLGENGCYLHNKNVKRHFPAANFRPVDTTGAADAFVSALAVYLSEDHDIVSSIKFATYAAGFSITRDGVQPALADRMAMDIYSEQYNSN